MNPEILPVTSTQIDWPNLRKSVANATGIRPSDIIAQSPVKFSEKAEFLLFTAYLYLDSTEENPHTLLLNLPRECLEFLHYTFIIACGPDTINDLREKTRAHYTMTDLGKGYCVLGTGPLSVWFDAITLNLIHPYMNTKGYYSTRIIFDKLMLFFEKEGLSAIFSKYIKKSLPDKTFLLGNK
jgi:hypothetical protein